ncbi:adenosine deaminase [Thaumasiovibrio sp. DFM-14]|uniref:adenosine deaminase n=1 Tax=Thaumasiovibrio sp. DFM-14 TaxID=3384792 RepID=UPI0039A3B242
MESFLKQMPKVELHLHIEGAMTAELMLQLAHKNNIILPYPTLSALEEAYKFDSMDDFLELYFLGCQVLQSKEDFFTLTWHYLSQCAENNVMHCEIFFDPQAHISRGVTLETQIAGISEALKKAENEYQISHQLIACFLRDKPQPQAMQLLEELANYRNTIHAIGLDSTEPGYPPLLFREVFARARQLDFKAVAHAGESAGPEYIWQALTQLQVDRIDHGVSATQDSTLVEHLLNHRIPLTMCPISNVKLGVVDNIAEHNIAQLLRQGLCITINSDSPSYFNADIFDNLLAVQQAHHLTHDELGQLTLNAIEASFATTERKADMISIMMSYLGHDDEFAD